MRIGCHLSIQHGIEQTFGKAIELGCESFQVFTQNQRQWISKLYPESIRNKFTIQREKHGFAGVRLVAHASYLINLCAAEPEKLDRSRSAFLEELRRCDSLGIEYVVIHPGAHGGQGEAQGIKLIAGTLNQILNLYKPKVKILLETIAGQGTGIGHRFEQLASIISQVEHDEHVGICLDTCHLYSAGYDVGTATGWQKCLDQITASFRMDRVGCIHLNDSKYPLGSRKDRHAALGSGHIDLEGFRFLMNCQEFYEIPGILEVPGGEQVFSDNLKLLKSFRNRPETF